MVLRSHQPVTLFSDRTHYQREARAELSDVLRPYWKEGVFDSVQREEMYGLSDDDFILVRDLMDADLAVLPMTWNYYLARGQTRYAMDFIEAARRAHRPVLSYVSGDEGVTVPAECEDVWVVRASGRRSRRRKRQVAQPVFFDDPLQKFPELLAARPKKRPGGSELPVVGFCGQASVNPLKLIVDLVRCLYRNGCYHAGWRLQEPQPLFPPALLRAHALRALQQSKSVQTDFIIRSRYRAGADTVTDREQSTREFYTNIACADYTLCVRGGGNFSKRFYETLAMGRVPILLDTDCLLPLEAVVSWQDYVVRAEPGNIATLARQVSDHYQQRGQGLTDLKGRCRQLWEESLSFAGFHRQLVRVILSDSEAASSGASWDFAVNATKQSDPSSEFVRRN